MQKEQIKQLVDRITGTQIKEPNPRVKAIVEPKKERADVAGTR